MATLVRWDPFREIAQLQSDLSRALGAFREGNGDGDQRWVPAVDAWETENEIVYAFDLPGVSQDKISIELEDNALTVSAERERTHEVSGDRAYRFERRFGSFSRTVTVPQGVNEESITAQYRDGVLEVHVPKPEERKPRRIQIGSGQQSTIEGKGKRS